ncbi:hypothetical protein C5C12_14475 [Pseudoclavibacter sp. RFBJ5]|nr:hypothetical protein C5C12_14475 [Pseudoclavibacter sp. RFBJ5]PPG19986.1 hypothetical protein C5E13_14675 [Pseudoclavibacter sp. RFBI4]
MNQWRRVCPSEDVARGDVGQRRCHLPFPRVGGRVLVVEIELGTGQVEPAVGGDEQVEQLELLLALGVT